MDYMKNAARKTIGSSELVFVRCDKNGNEISDEILRQLNFSNSTIDHLVTQTAERITMDSQEDDGSFAEGLSTYFA